MLIVEPEDLALHVVLKKHTIPNEPLNDVSVEHIGKGGWGDAFANDDKVYKVTGSITEAIYALELKQKKLDSCAEIHDVYLYQDDDFFYFIIEQERVITLEDADHITELFLALSIANLTFEDDVDFILKKIAENGFKTDKLINLIEQGSNIAQDLYLNGFWMTDIHQDNVGIRKTSAGDKLVLFDQMNTSLESLLTDELCKTNDLLSIMARNVNPEVLSSLKAIDKKAVAVTQNIDEITNFMNDIIYAFNTEGAFKFLSDGDWCAGGCLAFAKILFDEVNGHLSGYTNLKNDYISPEIACIKNYNTGNIEHFFVKLGDLILDAAGVHNGEKSVYLNSFIAREAPHLKDAELGIQMVSSSDVINSFVDIKRLHNYLIDSGLLPSSEKIYSNSVLA